jgi:hypothetical protein
VQGAADKLADLRPCPRSRPRQGAGACARAADGEVPAVPQRTARRSRASSRRDRCAQMGELRPTHPTRSSVGGPLRERVAVAPEGDRCPRLTAVVTCRARSSLVASASWVTSSRSEQPTSGASSQPPKAPLSCACSQADSNEPGLVEIAPRLVDGAGAEALADSWTAWGAGEDLHELVIFRRLRALSARRLPSDGCTALYEDVYAASLPDGASSRAITTPPDMHRLGIC